MPWSIVKRSGRYCLKKDSDGSIVPGSCHKEKSKTLAMLRALYANEGKSMEEIMLSFGGELKALGDGKFGGYLITFSDENSTDLEGDFFTKSTEFFQEDGAKLPILFEHGLDSVIKRRKLGMGTIKTDEVGVWLEFHLSRRDEYEKAIAQATAKGKTGLSSGAANHLVAKSKVNKANRVEEWGLAEASVTFTPMEPTSSIMTLKSYADIRNELNVKSLLDEEDGDATTEGEEKVASIKSSGLSSVLTRHVDDRIDDGHDRASIIKSLAREAGLEVEQIETILAGESVASVPNLKAFARVLEVSFEALKAAKQRDYSRTIKGMFEELGESPSRMELDAKYCEVVKNFAAASRASQIAGTSFDLDAKVKEATDEYTHRLKSLTVTEIESYISSGSDEPFYLKAIINLSNEGLETDHLDLEQHSQLVASAETGILKRFRRFYETRIKAGRVLSEKTRQRIASVRDNAMQLASDCDALLEETKPMASDSEKRAAETAFLRLQHQALQRGLNAN